MISTQPSRVITCREHTADETTDMEPIRSVWLLPAHLEDDDPGVGDVVEVDGSFVGVSVPGVAPGVVAVPVDAEPGYADAAVGHRLRAQAQRLAVQGIVFVQAARPASLAPSGDIGAGHDAVVDRQRADEGPLVVLVGHVVRLGQPDAGGAGTQKRVRSES